MIDLHFNNIRNKECPHCHSQIVFASIETTPSLGGIQEIVKYSCGHKVSFDTNTMLKKIEKICPRSQQAREQQQNALEIYHKIENLVNQEKNIPYGQGTGILKAVADVLYER